MSAEARELVIVGGGPAALGAAIEARTVGVQTTLLEERAALGGQIYRQLPTPFQALRRLDAGASAGRRLIARAEASGAEIRLNSVVWGIWGNRLPVCEQGRSGEVLEAGQIILATGAYDRPVAFPGWTLPGVMTAGGTQALLKTQRILPGRRILVTGTGPLLPLLAARLLAAGAEVAAVVEAAPFPSPRQLARLITASCGSSGKLALGLVALAYLRRHRVPLFYSHITVKAEGHEEVKRAVIARVDVEWRPIAGTEQSLDVDTVSVGYGFVPSVELARLSGAEHGYDEDLGGYLPTRDEGLRTTAPGILAAGDGARISGAAMALEEGRLAGLTAAHDLGRLPKAEYLERAGRIRRRLARLERFRSALMSLYLVRPGIYALVTPDTIVCRCQEVTAGELQAHLNQRITDANSLKGLTRAGMGLCQGRNCWRQIRALIARASGRFPSEASLFTPRPPVKPVPIGVIGEEVLDPEMAVREAEP